MSIDLTLSVHQLVDFLLRGGDIDNRVYNKSTMAMGSKIHAYYQKKQNEQYLSEYSLQEVFPVEGFTITLQGRADGIIVNGKKVVIDEIKSTVMPLDDFYHSQVEWHLGQAKCYALMYAHEKKLESIDIRLTYISQLDDNTQMIAKQFSYTTEQLEEDIYQLMKDYLNFYQILYRKKTERNLSAKGLKFPFSNFRSGQRELSKYSYSVAQNGGTLFVEAPTGIGKTMSTLYPFCLAFQHGDNEKIFYLTAKSSGRESALNATEILKQGGLRASEILITAKDKICFNPGCSCNPDDRPYTRGYYNKLQSVITEAILNEDKFDLDTILKYAVANDMCPFELELDLSLFVDIIICDYNYVFDPLVYLKRYFEETSEHYVTLIDEAHNLIDRGRSMFSTSISLYQIKNTKKDLKNLNHKKMNNSLTKLIKFCKEFLELREGEEEYHVIPEFEDKFISLLNTVLKNGQDILKNHHEYVTDSFLDFYFSINKFLKICELLDDSFIKYLEFKGDKDVTIKIYCLDPSTQLARGLRMFKSKVLFSATLSPADYYVRLLGGKEEDSVLILDSPFPVNNLLIMVQPNISTKYKNRENSYTDIAKSILACCKNKMGNYFVFFPSYVYLQKVQAILETLINDEYSLLVQTKEMDENERVNFLSRFEANPTHTTIGLVVLGGAFGEGIDLIDDRLIGAIIVGVGLPQICFERNLIQDYHNHKGENGFDYAYVNSGMNKVMQAAGRVIRSEKDKGVLLLIDERYTHRNYSKMFKGKWRNYKVVTQNNEIDKLTKDFWKK